MMCIIQNVMSLIYGNSMLSGMNLYTTEETIENNQGYSIRKGGQM